MALFYPQIIEFQERCHTDSLFPNYIVWERILTHPILEETV